MSNPLQFSVEFGRKGADHRPKRGEPLRILYITDLGESCRSRRDMPLETRPMRTMDIDRFDDLLNDEMPTVTVPSGDLTFRDIEDFHPDQIIRSLPVFQRLKDLRARLKVPATFDTAAQEVRALLKRTPEDAEVQTPATDEDDSATLSRLFGQPASDPRSAAGSSAPKSFLDTLLQEAVAAHITAEADPRAEHYVAALDDALAAHLTGVLHHPAFQELEAAWRGLNLLVSQVETDEELTIHVWNASKSELVQALGPADGAPNRATLHKRIVEEHEAHPFTLIVADHSFDASGDDIRLLATLGAMAGRTNGLVLAQAAPGMIGAGSWRMMTSAPESVGEVPAAWDALRATPMADHIVALGLRFLLRAPYGKKTDPIDAFAYEETPQTPDVALLWGSSPLIACILMAQSFRDAGWDAHMNEALGFDDLPLVPFEEHGTPQIRPCAETLLPDRSAEAILTRGVVPVLAVKNQNAVRLPWFQTISSAKRSGRLGPFAC